MESLIISDFLFYDSYMHIGIFSGMIFGFFCGIVSGIFFTLPDISEELKWFVFGIFCFSFLLRKITRYQFLIPVIIAVTIGGIFGFWRTNDFHKKYPFGIVNQYHEQTITVTGKVYKPPEITPTRQTLLVQPTRLNGIPLSNNIVIAIRISPVEKFQAGDMIRATGKFQLRSDFESDTGRIVQYRLMSYSKKILGDISFPTSVRLVGHEKTMYTFFSSIKNTFTESLHKTFMLPASGLLSGMMLGDTSALDNSLLDTFRMVGLIHIVVLSGYNVTLITNTFIKIFSFRGYFGRIQFAMISLVIFIGIVGISATALRAGIMAACAFIARYFVRPSIITRVLLFALAVMVFISPYSLLFDLSLQLSFLATCGIVYLFPFLQEIFPRLSEGTFAEIVLQTVAVNIVVMPLILYQMGTISPVFLPVNVLVLGFIPFLTIGGFIVTLIGILFPQIAIILAYPIQMLTDWIIQFADWTASHDPFFTTIPQFSLHILIGIYVVIFGFLIFIHQRKVV